MLAIWPFQGRRVLISVPTPQRSGSAGLAGGNSRGPALPSWGRCLGPLSTPFVGGLPPQRLRSPTWCVPSPSSGPEGDKHKGQGQVAFLPDPLGGRALEPPLCMQHTGGEGQGSTFWNGGISLWFCCYQENVCPERATVPAPAGLDGSGWHPPQPRGIDPFRVDAACPHGVAGSVSTGGQPKLGAWGVLTWQVTQGSPAQEGSLHQPGSSWWCGKCEVTF